MSKLNSLLRLLALTLLAGTAAAETATSPAISPKGRVANVALHSAILGRDVPLHVWLPPGYDEPANAGKKYPVMYLLDGKKMFDAVTDVKSELHLDASLDRLSAEGKLPPIVVVGIEQSDNDGTRRDEYTPYRDVFLASDGFETHGQRLPDFLVTEVLPKIGAAFRVSENWRERGIGGLSYSGAASLYVLMRLPTVFGLAVIESPSLQVGNGQLLRDTMFLTSAGVRVAIGVGTREAGPKESERLNGDGLLIGDCNRWFVRSCETLATNLRALAIPPEVQLVVEEGAQHKAEAWARRIPQDLVFLFKTPL